MVAILEKSDAAEGFEQIIDFLSGSYINHALLMNPYVYISCIKQFWNTFVVKRSGDVTRLQALVNKKRIVITEEVVRKILQLNDAEGVICLPNEEIFAGLARMGYEKPSTKLTFYKAFFSTQWKFFIHTILHSLSAKRTSWNEFSLAMASALICLSSDQRVRKGFSRVETPLFENMLAVRDVAEEAEAQIVKLKARVKKLEKINKVKSSKLRRLRKVGTSQRVESSNDVENVFNQGRMIVDIDQDEGIDLLKTLTITAAPAVSTRRRKGVVIRDPEEELPSDTPAETPKVKDKGKGILIEAPKPMKKKDQIEMDADINETPAQKAAKRRKLSEEAQEADDLRKRLEIVQDEDDDVVVEATPLAQKYSLSRFTLEQLVNVARLQVEKESKMSLELLRLTRQQLQEYQQG
nr:hypothetical protein [Tanacetum cinerariifolium]